jgi:hypothetical protein
LAGTSKRGGDWPNDLVGAGGFGLRLPPGDEVVAELAVPAHRQIDGESGSVGCCQILGNARDVVSLSVYRARLSASPNVIASGSAPIRPRSVLSRSFVVAPNERVVAALPVD